MNWDIPVFSAEEGKRRHRAIREVMRRQGTDGLIIAGHIGIYKGAAADVRYVSNYCMWFDDEYVLFPLEGDPILYVWSKIHADWAEKVSWVPVKVSPRGQEGRDHAGEISRRVKELGLEKATLGIVNMRTMPAYVYAGLREQLPQAEFVPAGDVLRSCRLVKSAEELEFVRRSAHCADKGFEAVLNTARPGVSEADLVAECERAMVKAGAELGSFILLRSGPWSEMKEDGIYFGGSRRVLAKGDVILDEITPSYGGTHTQICRPISIGTPPDDLLRLYHLHEEMYELARKELRPGNTIEAVETQVAELALRRGGYSRGWCLQSGELIDTSSPFRGELKAGMVIVNHPFTQSGPRPEYGGHTIGDTFIVRDGAPEALSKAPFEFKVI